MNKFLLSAALVLSAATASLAGQLQGFAISGAPLITVRGGYSQTSDMEAAVVITNNTGRALSLRVQRQVRSAVTGSENYFCTPITCYTPTVTLAPASFALANGASNSDCHFYYTPNNQAGITTIRYAFFELGSQDSAYVTVRFDASQRVLATTASKAPESVLSQPWPNPAAAGTTSELTYALPANSRGAHLVLVSMADGRRVRDIVLPITLAEGLVRFRTDGLAAGIYSCLLLSGADGRGELLAARRLQVQ
jgi:hypothetical protein